MSVSIAPSAASVLLGATQPFTASVANSSNTAVSWSVNGVPGGNSAVGTIPASGLYTAPQNLPAGTPIRVQAISQADPSKSASAAVSILSDITLGLTPAAADVELGALRQFQATVSSSGNPNRAVSWSVAGPGCAGAACGTMDSSGLFTAPQIRPALSSVLATATSAADPSKVASAVVNITSNFTLAVSGPGSVGSGATAQFAATLTPAPNSNPSPIVSWSVSGPGCTGTACGTVTSTGSYTAPALAPSPNTLSITATPAADPTKAASVAVTINAVVSVSVSPAAASVELGRPQPFTATVTGAQDQSVTWDVNGVVGGNQTVGTVTNSTSNSGTTTYTAPLNLPAPNQVAVRARSNADPNAFAAASVTLFSSVAVQISPTSATRAVNHRQTFAVQVTGISNQNVQWQVNGIPGGDATVGQICVVNSNPCQQVTISSAGSVDYLAPGALPTRNPVTLTAISQADPTKSASAQVTILAYVVVSVSPASATLAPQTTQLFTATVLGTANQNVFWQLSGGACSGPGSPCGVIDATGFYTAPIAPPSPNTLSVLATSAEDTSRSGSASVTIAAGANITTLLPASATAGAAGGFLLVAQGSGFVASSPGPSSTMLFNGSARSTTCSSSNQCSTSLATADLASAGSLPVQIRNPDGTTSNQVAFVVVAAATSDDLIPLTPAAPSASGKNIVVVEPSTAGASATQNNVNLNIVALGFFSASTNNCVLGGNSLVLLRPASGTADVDICGFSPSGLDPSLTYTTTGPAPNDISLIAKQPLGLGIVRLTLELASTTRAGARTLFVENPNKDKSAATGALEVK